MHAVVPELHVTTPLEQNGSFDPLELEELEDDTEPDDQELEDDVVITQSAEPGKNALEVSHPGTVPSPGINLHFAVPVRPFVHTGLPESQVI